MLNPKENLMKILPLIALTASLLTGGHAFAAEQTVTLNVANATCELCGPIVKRALSNVPGVLDVDVSEATGAAIAKVRFDDSQTNVAALITATTNAGYPSGVSRRHLLRRAISFGRRWLFWLFRMVRSGRLCADPDRSRRDWGVRTVSLPASAFRLISGCQLLLDE